jgi:hypothetical protein
MIAPAGRRPLATNTGEFSAAIAAQLPAINSERLCTLACGLRLRSCNASFRGAIYCDRQCAATPGLSVLMALSRFVFGVSDTIQKRPRWTPRVSTEVTSPGMGMTSRDSPREGAEKSFASIANFWLHPSGCLRSDLIWAHATGSSFSERRNCRAMKSMTCRNVSRISKPESVRQHT